MNEGRYVIGVDGGGTKTDCLLADLNGRVLGYGKAGGANHQIDGIAAAMENVARCVDEACSRAGADRRQIAFAFLGLAGADLREDFDLLNASLKETLAPIPFEVVNDSWIAFWTEERESWGAVSVCGTGSNMGVRTPNGDVYTVRALGYMLGGYGGGLQLAETAMHYAFRDSEGTGEPTLLSRRLPAVCGCATMDELALRTDRSDGRYPRDFNIPRLIFDLAEEGDAVCRRILRRHGAELGEMLGRFITRAGLAGEKVPVVLSGTLYTKDRGRRMLDPLTEKLKEFVPGAQTTLIQSPPVVGAVFGAFSAVGKRLPDSDKQAVRAQAAEMLPP